MGNMYGYVLTNQMFMGFSIDFPIIWDEHFGTQKFDEVLQFFTDENMISVCLKDLRQFPENINPKPP